MKTFQQLPSSPHFLTSTNSSLHHYTAHGFKKFPTLCCALCCPDPHLCRMDCTCSTSPAWTLLAPSSNPVLLRIILLIHLVPSHGKHCRNGFSTRRCGWAWKTHPCCTRMKGSEVCKNHHPFHSCANSCPTFLPNIPQDALAPHHLSQLLRLGKTSPSPNCRNKHNSIWHTDFTRYQLHCPKST